MSHAFHPALDGYDERQIFHDGCSTCEDRGNDVALALAHMDDSNFDRAWKRAFDLHASAGDGSNLGVVSYAESDLLNALWGVMLAFERRGMKLDGKVPRFTVLRQVMG